MTVDHEGFPGHAEQGRSARILPNGGPEPDEDSETLGAHHAASRTGDEGEENDMVAFVENSVSKGVFPTIDNVEEPVIVLLVLVEV